ncbi:hypothetical protein TUM20985_03930 [Mycobacterium antarcticum]|uniref:hypothetical protein n=1 Tax=unclassified Mycolicibacterium TaxID=2636767 RepID=UPI0023959DE4|nr:MULTISPECIES: hypothetical protein [unclassified Mycolicibacterium]BDX29846.1 hypothetical protein TUM20985_03930 [Mycolicibacterium sp. TUM20985]GLP73269.1 hypothetical protein TUM20983_03790 [Mycolicibacterium sp. TUM20983]GLP78983.1 hypothetical protein TUM20984_04030 [Mycolicibacterium sp. TUM20984]
MKKRHSVAAAACGLLALGAAVAFPATAAADDPPPDPALIPGAPPPPPPPGPTVPMMGQLGPAGLDVLAQSNAPGVPGTLGAPPVVGLDQTTILGLNAAPAPPGGGTGTPPNLNVFNNAYGIQLNEVPSAPGQGQQFDVAPGAENADVTRREWFGRWIDMQRAGRTYGGLGQAPQQQLGQPLPGTAPPPGTVIPPGLVQFLPDPADGPTPPPGLILPPPPPEG